VLIDIQEAEKYELRQGIPFYEYSSASEVFAVGQTMLSLIYLRDNRNVPQYRFDDASSIPPRPTDSVKSTYPKPLLDLVYNCLWPRPADRITAENLCLEIRKHVGTCPSLKDLPLKLQSGLLGGEALRCKPVPYADWAKEIK
jgi:hypothetical protein